MANILYLVHRLPYPPNKGDKLRSYHLLKHLAARHRVFLGTFVDDPDDQRHVATVQALCADSHIARLKPRLAKLRSLPGLLSGAPLTLGYYRDAGLRRWVEQLARRERLDAVVVFSSSMAPYLRCLPAALPTLVDFVDVDSAKWTQYAGVAPAAASAPASTSSNTTTAATARTAAAVATTAVVTTAVGHAADSAVADAPGQPAPAPPLAAPRWPMSWVYRREGTTLLAFERAVATAADRSFFVTAQECALFAGLAPECAGRIEPLGNGVDADYFAPDPARPSPFAIGELPIVFTGAMDYWPNADAVLWFAAQVLPRLRAAWPALRLHVVGRAPGAAVRALAAASPAAVAVSGTVPDVRPYLQHAALVVAPLRVARGVQNKVLEAMAMGRAVVAAAACADAVGADTGRELLAAGSADDFVRQIDTLLRAADRAAAIGAAGRARVLRSFSWPAQLGRIDRHLDTLLRTDAAGAVPASAGAGAGAGAAAQPLGAAA